MAAISTNKKKRLKVLMLISSILIVMLLAYLFLFSGNSLSSKSKKEAMRTIVVTKQEIPAYARITSDMLEEKKVASTDQNANAAQSIKEVADKYTLVGMVAGEPVLKNHISKGSGSGIGSGLGVKLAKNTRAMSLKVDDVSGISGLLKVGNRVDIMYATNTGKASDNEQIQNNTSSVYLMQNIPVLALNSSLSSEAKPDPSKEISSSTNVSKYTIVTLQLTTDQAQQFTAAIASGGKVYLALRPQDEGDKTVQTAPVSVSDIVVS